jgi:hypothetical protein
MCRWAIAAAVVACPAAQFARAEEGDRPRDERDQHPICMVKVTPIDGPPTECFLLAFEDGTFVLRYRDQSEYRLRQEDVASVKFSPLPRQSATKAEMRDRPPREAPEDRGRADDERRFGFPAPAEMRTRLEETLRTLEPMLVALKRSGEIRAYIVDHEGLIRASRDPQSVRDLMLELHLAHRVNGQMPDREYWRALLESIEDPAVRRSPIVNLLRGGPARRFGR